MVAQVEKKIDFETELALQFVDGNPNDILDNPYNTIKQMKSFLISKKLVKDENQIEIVWGPFTELEMKLFDNENDSEEEKDTWIEKRVKIDEDY